MEKLILVYLLQFRNPSFLALSGSYTTLLHNLKMKQTKLPFSLQIADPTSSEDESESEEVQSSDNKSASEDESDQEDVPEGELKLSSK